MEEWRRSSTLDGRGGRGGGLGGLSGSVGVKGGGGVVSLRGRSAREDGARATAEEARRLRQRRATERKERAMAMRIQKAWRGLRAKIHVAKKLREESRDRRASGQSLDVEDIGRAYFYLLSPLMPLPASESEDAWEATEAARLLAASVGDGRHGGGDTLMQVESLNRNGHDGHHIDEAMYTAQFAVRGAMLLRVCTRIFSRYGRVLAAAHASGEDTQIATTTATSAPAAAETRRAQEQAILRALIAVRSLTDASIVPQGKLTVAKMLQTPVRNPRQAGSRLGCELLQVICDALGLYVVSHPSAQLDAGNVSPARKAALQTAALLASRCVLSECKHEPHATAMRPDALVVGACATVFGVPFAFSRWKALSQLGSQFLSSSFQAMATCEDSTLRDTVSKTEERGGNCGTGPSLASSSGSGERGVEHGTSGGVYLLGNVAQSAKEYFESVKKEIDAGEDAGDKHNTYNDNGGGRGSEKDEEEFKDSDSVMEDVDVSHARLERMRCDALHVICCVTRLLALLPTTHSSSTATTIQSILGSAQAPVLDQMRSLYDGTMLDVFVEAALARGDTIQTPPRHASMTTTRTSDDDYDMRLGDLTYFLLSMQPREDARSAALTALAFRTNFVRLAWKRVESRLSELKHSPNSTRTLPLVISFCEVFAYELIVVDDEDMYEIGRPLSLGETANVVALLKPLVSRLMKEGVSAKPSSSSSSITATAATSSSVRVPLWAQSNAAIARDDNCVSPEHYRTIWDDDDYLVGTACIAMSRLLSRLYDRNSRRRFIPAEGFVSDVGDSRFVAEAAESISQMEDDGSLATNDRSAAMKIGMRSGSSRPDTRIVLEVAPFIVSFPQRVRILRSLIRSDRERVIANSSFDPITGAMLRYHRTEATIRRTHVVEDGWRGLGGLTTTELKRSIRINFVNEFGLPEAGVDGGGLFKDFLDCFIIAAFNPDCGLFQETPDHLLYPNPASASVVGPDHLRQFEFLGRMVGKAIYEGILLELPFAGFFLTKLRRRTPGLHDLVTLDPELARSLRFFRRYDGDFDDLSVFFAIDDDVELVPNGRNIPVTKENVLQYTHLVANHRLNTCIRSQTAAFLMGFQELVRPSWLAMFNESELQVLLSGYEDTITVDGTSTIIDMGDLLLNVGFSAGYDAQHPTILMLWEVIANFTPQEQRDFLKFVTACSRVPLLGFGALEPKLQIQRSGIPGIHAPDADADISRLPTSATCMNLLKLPPYKDLETLRSKLKYSMQSASGFDLA